MDHLQAWRHFYDVTRPTIWAELDRNARRDINTAERDYHMKRKDIKGQPVVLGADRVARILDRFSPGVYGVEVTVRFWVV
jgi:hypothetical protein